MLKGKKKTIDLAFCSLRQLRSLATFQKTARRRESEGVKGLLAGCKKINRKERLWTALITQITAKN